MEVEEDNSDNKQFSNNIIISNNPQKPEEDDQFPIGLKVLAIDANIVCLKYLVHLLLKCQYKVTATREASEAIRLLKDEKEGNFDIIITNVVRRDMDGFNILNTIGRGMDIPVVMVSANDELEMVKRGVMEGAEAYLLKPLRLEELRNIWQHVLRKRSSSPSTKTSSIPPPNLSMEQPLLLQHQQKLINKDEDDINNNVAASSSSSSKKKPRVSWTKELHDNFLAAYDQLREKERVPNNILKLMNHPDLSRENVASHLQKHRNLLRKKKASGLGKLVGHKNYYDRNPTKALSTIDNNSMNQRNKDSNLRPQLPISGQFQFPNRARSSMEELQGNENLRSRWRTAAGSYFPVPEFKMLNFPSNNWITKPYDQYIGFGPYNTNSYYSQYPLLESNCLNSASVQSTFGNCSIDNNGAIPDHQAAADLSWSFPNNSTTAGQCSQMQFDQGNPHGSLLMDDDLSEIFKQFKSDQGAF